MAETVTVTNKDGVKLTRAKGKELPMGFVPVKAAPKKAEPTKTEVKE